MDKVEHNIFENGIECWVLNDQYHREDGPAIIFPDGEIRWYRHGSIHREDGPAIILKDGKEEMWLFNQHYSYDKWVKIMEQHLSTDKLVELKCRYG